MRSGSAEATLTVCLDARLIPESAGGTASVVIGLAYGLSQLQPERERYLLLAHPGRIGWLKPYTGDDVRILEVPEAKDAPAWKSVIRKGLPLAPRVWRRAWAELGWVKVPESDGSIEQAGTDVVHFTLQTGFLTGVPSIYHPHDLQHLHLPEYFARRERLVREVIYRRLCAQAVRIVVTSSWVKKDLMESYQIAAEKIRVIPWPPVTDAYEKPSSADLRETQGKFDLPAAFAFYPAQTYPHKNHLGLLEALRIIRDRQGIGIPLVCSGWTTDYFRRIQLRMRELRVEDQVKFLGFVTPLELQSLYRLCQVVVVPTKFEAASGPVGEAFLAGVAVACSNVTSLPEQAGDAALLFDPESPESMADALLRLWGDEALRGMLVERGRQRIAKFSWVDTARTFRALYRQAAGRLLSEEDQQLVAADRLL